MSTILRPFLLSFLRPKISIGLTIVLFGLSLITFAIGPINSSRSTGKALPLIQGEAAVSGNFGANATYFTVDPKGVPNGIGKYGSWMNSNGFKGRSETGWYQPQAHFTVMVCGYPVASGNRLSISVRRAGRPADIVLYRGINPGEIWIPWVVDLPADATGFKVVAIDDSSEFWLAYADPIDRFEIPLSNHICSWAQVATTTLLAMIVLYGPGLIWVLKNPFRPARWAEAILIGPLLLAALGTLTWIFGGYFSPRWLGGSGIFAIDLIVCLVLIKELRKERPPNQDASEPLLFVAVTVIACLAVCKATLSLGPEGEMFRGTISRTLSSSGHPDSRISFGLVQVIAHHFSPTQPQTVAYYAPWRLTSRGPLAGLLAAPIVLATGAQVTSWMPDQAWSPFDHSGFAAYRIALIVLASLSAWAVFGALSLCFSPKDALFGTTFCLLAPFFIHELFFTWPKLIAGAQVLLAFVFLQRRQPLLAGVAVALGYLYHPLAILSAPFLGLWSLRSVSPSTKGYLGGVNRARSGAKYILGLAITIAPWQLFDHFIVSPHLVGGQTVFLSYFRIADDRIPTVATWLLSRWHNFAYTFIPGYYLSVNPAHASINSIYGPSDAWVRNLYIYWKTLPFAFGFAAFCVTLPSLCRALRSRLAEALILFVGPAAFIIVYWGAADTGFMGYCGHYLFLTYICMVGYSVVTDKTASGNFVRKLISNPWLIALRLIEIATFCYATTFHYRLPRSDSRFFIDDIVTLSFTAALFVLLFIIVRGCFAPVPVLNDFEDA